MDVCAAHDTQGGVSFVVALRRLRCSAGWALLIALSLAPRKLGCTDAVLAVRSEEWST